MMAEFLVKIQNILISFNSLAKIDIFLQFRGLLETVSIIYRINSLGPNTCTFKLHYRYLLEQCDLDPLSLYNWEVAWLKNGKVTIFFSYTKSKQTGLKKDWQFFRFFFPRITKFPYISTFHRVRQNEIQYPKFKNTHYFIMHILQNCILLS